MEVLKKVREVFYDLKEDERELMRRYMKSMFIACWGRREKSWKVLRRWRRCL